MIRSRSFPRNIMIGRRVTIQKRNVPTKSKILKEVKTSLTTPLFGNTSGLYAKNGSPYFQRTDLGTIMECIQVGISKAFKMSKK